MVEYQPPTGRRVVVTGCGVVSPVGVTTDDFWTSLVAGVSGVDHITSFDTSDLPVSIAGEVKGFDPLEFMPRTLSRRIDLFAQFAIAAAHQATQQAKLKVTDELSPRMGVYVGSAGGPSQLCIDQTIAAHERGIRAIKPYYFAASGLESATAEIAVRLQATGPSNCITTACATGASCIGDAARLIRFGFADVMVAGGSDHTVTRMDLGSGSIARALSRRNDEPTKASRPFDQNRDGFVMGSGAAVLILEDLESAQRRGAEILAEIVGYGATTDAYHITAPHPEGAGAERAIRSALAEAGVSPSEVDYINAHGTSTRLNDETEVRVLRRVFGEHLPRIPISSIKSMTGHMLGAAGAAEFVATIKVFQAGVLPPTINCDDPIDDDLDFVANASRAHTARVAVSNSFGFGGHNAVLVARAWSC